MRAMQRLTVIGLLGAALTGVGFAGTFVAFGPETFREGGGKPVPRTFTVMDPTAPYTLRVDNSGVTSGEVRLNGVTILAPRDFGQGTTLITRPVTLLASNQLIVSIDARPSASLTLQITGVDNVPPSLAITSPPNNSTVQTPSVTVQGTVSDQTSGVAGVTCNAAPASITGSNFSCVVNLNPGPNTITVRATDKAGNVATASITVTRVTLQITDFNPKSAPVGTLVNVAGSGFVPAAGAVPQLSLNKQGGGTLTAVLASFTNTALSFVIPAGADSGPLVVTVNGQSATSAVPLTIIASSNFTLTALPSTATLIQGQSVAYSVQLTSANAFNQLAQLAVGGVPAGVTAAFKPQSITAGQTSILTLSAPAGQALGTSNLTISASATVDGIPLSQSAAAQLSVVAPTTSFMGRTVVDDPLQTPLAGVTVTMLGKDGSAGTTGCAGSAVSDAAGNFALRDLDLKCTGRQLVGFDGTTAISPAGDYAGVNLVYTLVAGQVTVSPVLVHLPRIDNKETFLVQQNAAADQSYSYRSIPGVSLTVYAGTTFTMPNGSQPNPFPLVAVQVPVDRLPDAKPPVPTMLLVFIVAFQPANVRASQPVAVYYPNTIQTRPGVNMTMMTLDPTRGTMVPYGTGTVSPDGTQIVPDLDPAFPGRRYGIVNFDWHGPMPPPEPPTEAPKPDPCPQTPPPCEGCCPTCVPAETPFPVRYSSGVEAFSRTDIFFGGPRGTVSLIRQYRTLTNNVGPFGIGANHNYGFSLDSLNPQNAALINLITPEWSRIPFSRNGNVLVNDTLFVGATMTTDPTGRVAIRFKDGTVWTFTLPGAAFPLLASITDRNGNVISLTRDPARPARITQVTDPVGRGLTLTYDGLDRIVSAVDPIGRTVTYTYNATGALATVTDPENGITTYGYSAPDRMVRETNPRGVVVMENTYDGNGRIIQQKLGDGGIYLMAYTLLNPTVGNSPVIQTVVTDPLGRATTYRFNPQQHLTDITDATGQPRIWERKAGSNLVAAIKGGGGCATCGRAGAGDMNFVYDDATGNLLSQTDALGHKTQYTYEAVFNKIATITDPLGNVTRFVYDSRGNLTSQTDANNQTTAYMYDQFGQLIETTDPLNQKTKLTYDTFGNLAAITDPLGNQTRFRYDGISRQVEVLDALGRRGMTDYDRLGRVTRQVDAKGGVTQFAYDPTGNLTSVTDARGKRTTFVYDGMDRLSTRTTPLNKTDSRTYDFNSNLTRFVDRRGQVSTFIYDALDRLVTETYQDSTVNRSYDAAGRFIRVEDSAVGVFTNTYDLTGGLLASAGPFGTVNYERDELGRAKSRQVVGQPAVGYAYDPAGNLASAAMPQASVGFTYNARNQTLTISRQNGVSSQYAYDFVGGLLSITHARGATPLSTLSYTNDAAGQRTSLQSNIAQPLITQATTATYDDGNRLLQRGTTTYAYDDNGNLISETGSAGTTTYLWDSRNRLAKITASSGQTTTFLYDFAGNLLQQKDAGAALNLTQTHVLDDITNEAYVSRSDGDQYSVLTAQTIDQHLGVVHASGQIEYGLADALSSTVATVDQTGAIKGRALYEPFGQTTLTGTEYPFDYTGRAPISQSLYYYRARYYNPAAGRFISEDTEEESSINDWRDTFLYAANNPIDLCDPFGTAAGGAIPYAFLPVQPPPVGIVCPLQARRNKWTCTAKCNVQCKPTGTPPPDGHVYGSGSGPSREAACLAAKKDANSKVPRDCYKRHCDCKCQT